MLADYHQIEFDGRVYLTHLEERAKFILANLLLANILPTNLPLASLWLTIFSVSK